MQCPKCGKNSVIRKEYKAHGQVKEVYFCITPGCKTRTHAKNVR